MGIQTDAWREPLAALCARGQTEPARQLARRVLLEDGSIGAVKFISRVLSEQANQLALIPLKVALLSSFSIEFIHDHIRVHAFTSGFLVDIYQAGFNAYRQEILDLDSGLYGAHPDVVILAVEKETLDNPVKEISGLVETFRGRSGAAVLVHNFAQPDYDAAGILEANVTDGGRYQIQRMNQALCEACRSFLNAYIVEYDGLVSRYGSVNWHDHRMRLYARAPIAQRMGHELAREYVKFFRALKGAAKKCLVLDGDNTLWGGILGEDGLEGIKLGSEYPGNAYAAVQEYVLQLKKRGVILALATKNNAQDIDELFASHPSMILKKEDFAAIRANWNPKSQSLREIAQQLNIGIEHVVLVDDSRVECEEIMRALPEVDVITLDGHPETYPRLLARDGLFDTLIVSSEDLRREQLYQQREQSEVLKTRSGNLEDFYHSLGMRLTFAAVDAMSLARSAQLTQKTNQFNATTIRYTESDLAKRMAEKRWVLTTVQVVDRFGDNGIVGLVMAERDADSLVIDTFLLSCRVIGRTVETAMLAFLCDVAAGLNLKRIRGRIVPTRKNIPVRDLYEQHGFARTGESENGETAWCLSLLEGRIEWPDHFEIERRE